MPATTRVLIAMAVAAGAAGPVAVTARSADSGTAAPGGAPGCLAPTDAAGIDAVLTAAGSPMAGTGRVIVDSATAAGIDPRLVVAIAQHETMLETYRPAQAIHNPFGLGPGMRFATEAEAIRFAVTTLSTGYLPEGRTTIALISAKWAPLGAANDPQGLNANWTAGVSSAYAALGGDPARPPLLDTQNAASACGAAPASPAATPAAPPAVGDGPPIVTVWGGNAPGTAGAATLRPFAFPLAVRAGGQARYASPGCTTGTACAVTITSAPGTDVVASTDGRLRAGSAADIARGIAFWVVRADGERIGYGPLASYAPGVSHDAVVRVGQPLGRSTGTLALVWSRRGIEVDPFPLLSATRPPDAA